MVIRSLWSPETMDNGKESSVWTLFGVPEMRKILEINVGMIARSIKEYHCSTDISSCERPDQIRSSSK